MRGLFIFGSSLTFLEFYFYFFCLVSEKKSEEVFERKRDGSLIFGFCRSLTQLDNQGFLLTFCCFLGPSYVFDFVSFRFHIFALRFSYHLRVLCLCFVCTRALEEK